MRKVKNLIFMGFCLSGCAAWQPQDERVPAGKTYRMVLEFNPGADQSALSELRIVGTEASGYSYALAVHPSGARERLTLLVRVEDAEQLQAVRRQLNVAGVYVEELTRMEN